MAQGTETGGKDLLLKKGKAGSASLTDESTTVTIADHGAKAGDVVLFGADAGGFLKAKAYYVLTAPTTGTMTLGETPTGAAVEATATIAAQAVMVYRAIGGMRSKSFELASESVNITNEDSDEHQEILDLAGIRSHNVSGDGVYNNSAVFNELEDDHLENRLVDMCFVDKRNKRVYVSKYKCTGISVDGGHDAEGNYSASFESSGPVTRYKVAS